MISHGRQQRGFATFHIGLLVIVLAGVGLGTKADVGRRSATFAAGRVAKVAFHKARARVL